MKNKLKTILCIMVSLLICGTAFAQTKPNPESDFKLIEEGDGYTYYVYVGKSEHVVIPKKIADYILFCEGWLSSKLFSTSYTTAKIKSVVIPEGFTETYSLFYELKSLERVSLPKSLKTIRYNAFYGCENLKEINIPDSVTSIGDKAFYGCENLKEINIPDSVTTIGKESFCRCGSLKEITIPPSVTNIGELAFLGSGITNIIISGNGLILNRLFTVTEINRNCYFYSSEINTDLQNVIISDGVVEIDRYAFENCKALTSVTIPSTVNKIGDGAFKYCENLVNVSISEGVTSIGSSAFYECKNLTSIKLPSTITKLEGAAFYGCDKLVSFIIPNGVTKIKSETFSHCKSLTNIDIPDSVTYIGKSAFCYCTSLKKIKLPALLPDITTYYAGEKWFFDTSIGKYAFSDCISLETIEFQSSDNIFSIGQNAFNNCKSLKNITIPGCIIKIKAQAFYGCENLENVTFLEAIPYETACNSLLKYIESLDRKEYTQKSDKKEYTAKDVFSYIIANDNIENLYGYCKREISSDIFKNCPALTSIKLPKKQYDTNFIKNLPSNAKISYISNNNSTTTNKTSSIAKTDKKDNLEKSSEKASTGKTETNKASNKSSSAKEKTSASKTSDKTTTESSSVAKNSNKTPAKSSSAESKTEVKTDNPFENSTIFTPHITKGEMDITTEPFEYNGQTYTALSISGNTGSQKSDYSDSWEASCKSNEQMKDFIQKGDNISFKALGDGKTWVLYFVLYDDDKATYYSYEFATKKGKVMEFSVPYKKLKFADWSVYRKFKKEEIRTIIFTGNNAGQKADRSIKIFDVKVF